MQLRSQQVPALVRLPLTLLDMEQVVVPPDHPGSLQDTACSPEPQLHCPAGRRSAAGSASSRCPEPQPASRPLEVACC